MDKPDALIDLVYDLPAKYRRNAAFFMNRLTQGAARKLKDGQGNYLWQPSYQLGQPATLSGERVVEVPDMPDIAANAIAALYGDMDETYLIVDRIGIRVLRDPFGQCFAPQVLELRSNVFAGIGRLPIGPVTQIESLKYIDGAGVEQTVEAGLYTHFTDRLDLVPGARWPQLRGDAGGVRLRFKAGHDRIPPPVKQAVLLLVGQWYRHRMAINVGNIVNELPNGVKALLGPYRVIRV